MHNRLDIVMDVVLEFLLYFANTANITLLFNLKTNIFLSFSSLLVLAVLLAVSLCMFFYNSFLALGEKNVSSDRISSNISNNLVYCLFYVSYRIPSIFCRKFAEDLAIIKVLIYALVC